MRPRCSRDTLTVPSPGHPHAVDDQAERDGTGEALSPPPRQSPESVHVWTVAASG
jgi:hypothetical protein